MKEGKSLSEEKTPAAIRGCIRTFAGSNACFSKQVTQTKKATTKAQVLHLLQESTDSFEPKQLIERPTVLQKMEEGLAQVKRGEVMTIEESRQRLTKWLM